MWEEVMMQAVNNGIWAVLFCALLIYQLNDSRKREHKFSALIDSLTISLTSIKLIEQDIQLIKDAVIKKSKKMDSSIQPVPVKAEPAISS